MSPCLWCGQTSAPSTQEHVVPRWVRKSLGIDGDVAFVAGGSHGEAARVVHRRPHLALKLRDAICRGCNSGWLSDLEREVQPLLQPMLMYEGATTLDPRSQTLLATWAVKTAFHFEYAMTQKYAHVKRTEGYRPSEAERAWIFAHRAPPPRARIWLGAFDAEKTTPFSSEAAHMIALGPSGEEVPAHLTTMTVGYVAFQIFTIDFVTADAAGVADMRGPPPALDPFLTQIWPVIHEECAWPGPAFKKGDRDLICSWLGQLTPEQTAVDA